MTVRFAGPGAKPGPIPQACVFNLYSQHKVTIMQTHRITTLDLDARRLESDLRNSRLFRYSDAYSEFICGEWRSCMLWNKSGDVDDNFLSDYDQPACVTAFGQQMPELAAILGRTFNLKHLRFARLATLTPGSVLVPHRDYLELKEDLTRIHVPLATDSSCYSAEEGTVYQMKLGEVWFIDATQIHSAANFSKKPRTHLILDFSEVERIDTVVTNRLERPQVIAPENVVLREAFTPSERETIFALSSVIDLTNYKDVFGLLIKKYFTAQLTAVTVVDWMLEIARRSGNPDVVARVQWLYEHCLIQRRCPK